MRMRRFIILGAFDIAVNRNGCESLPCLYPMWFNPQPKVQAIPQIQGLIYACFSFPPSLDLSR